MYKALKKVFKRSLWTMLTVFFGILFAIALVGAHIADGFQAALNGFFGTNPYVQINLGESNGPDTDYYPSEYMKKDADGNPIYEKDDNNVWHAVYDDAAMRKNSQQVALQAAVEGSVLLWNNNDALPLAEGSRVSMFGVSSANYIYLGGGSGDMWVSPPKSGWRDIFNDYDMELNMSLYMKYVDLLSAHKRQDLHNPNEAAWTEVEYEVGASVTADDTAVMIISRRAGESNDILPTSGDNFKDPRNYLDLTVNEYDVLSHLVKLRDAKPSGLKKVVLLINSDNAMQFQNIKQLGIDACVWVGQGGTMSHEQIAAVLSGRGDYVMSGKLPDTFAYNNYSAPANANFGDNSWTESPFIDSNPNSYPFMTNNDKYIVYQEGIYVGYRYYETRYEDSVLGQGGATGSAGSTGGGAWRYADEVAYPFGYGDSYADFEYSNYSVKRNENGVDYDVSVTIKNKDTSEYDGKDVLQVYLQKPYTDYDKAHGIEKSAVELVGFAKTKKLEPGESDTVTVTVKEEEFRTYDADGVKTYIFEEGNYYLAFGTNAHDALNNILAKKGYTAAQGMDYNGKAEFAEKITVDSRYKGYKSDKFKISSYTENEITNRFDDADLNRYEGTKDDQSITYLSRSNWQDTYPAEGGVKLKCTNDKMIEDMMYGHPVEAKAGDEMPKYGQVTSSLGKLTLAMLMDLDYDDELWQDLLNQMTVQEQQFLISYGLNNLAGAKSVAAPGLKSRDGPAGVQETNKGVGTQMSFPTEPVLAATFNLPLVEEVGKAFGMEILHVGWTVIYGPGGCIHRSAYSGRNWEYFSEDGVLSGLMLAAECKGLQKYGVIVETKHYALNDTETNRYGIATFVNEQTIRDVYLRAFELAVTAGNMNGVMSSFNRLGCTWTGAHKGLMNDTLRDEWGFLGIVESDSCTGSTGKYVRHMCSIHAKAEGLMAGNDIWMCASGSEEFLIDHKNDHEGFEQSPPSGKITADDMFADVSYLENPTVMLALRESCHRILYAQLHSNAMNGMDASTRVLVVKVWWQKLLDALGITFGILTGLFALMAITSYIVNTVWFKEKLRAHRLARADHLAKIKSGETEDDRFGAMFKKMNKTSKILFYVSISVMIVIIVLSVVLPVTLTNRPKHENPPPPAPHVCGHVCEECGKCLDPDCTDPACAEKCPGNHPHRCKSVCEICGKCYNIFCEDEACKEKCKHGTAVHNFEAEDAELKDGSNTLNPNENGGNAVGNINGNVGASVTYYINSDSAAEASMYVTVSRRDIDTVFTDSLLITINGKEYKSATVVPATEDGSAGWSTYVTVNLGGIRLKEGRNTISFKVYKNDNYSGYNFDKMTLYCDADLEMFIPHKCEQKCSVCGRCLNPECDDEACASKCDVEGGTKYKLEAENAELASGKNGMPSTVTIDGGRTIVTGLSANNRASIAFTAYAEQSMTVNVLVTVSKRLVETPFGSACDIHVGNDRIATNAIVHKATGTADKAEYGTVNLGCIKLKRGKNVIKFSAISDDDIGFDFDCIEINAASEISSTPPAWYVPTTEYKFEAENATVVSGTRETGKNERNGVLVVWGLAGNTGTKITFNVYAEKNAKANLTAAFSPLEKVDAKVTDSYDITVNGKPVSSDAVLGHGNPGYPASVFISEIDLSDGTDNRVNVIEFTVKEGNGFDYFDYIILETVECELSVEYMAPTPSEHTHTYSSEWTYNDGYHWHAATCDHTFKKENYGAHTFDADNRCTVCGLRSYKYLASWATLSSGLNLQNGGEYVGGVNNGNGSSTGRTITVTVYAAKAGKQKFYVDLTRRKDTKISEGFELFFNNTKVTSADFMNAMFAQPQGAVGPNGEAWGEHGEVYLGEFDLTEGKNVFVLKVTSALEKQGNVYHFRFQGDTYITNKLTFSYKGVASRYEAEDATLGGGAAKDGSSCTDKDGTVTGMVGAINGFTGRNVTFEITADASYTVKLIVATTKSNVENCAFSRYLDVYLNDSKQTVADTVYLPWSGTSDKDWTHSGEVEVIELTLKEGVNTIKLQVASGEDIGGNLDYIRLVPVA